ncbi:MAG: hypothetical protein V1860_01870 [bacterium]
MFSKTTLGRFVEKILQRADLGIFQKKHELAIISLLLADAELYRDSETYTRIIERLRSIYGDDGLERWTEPVPSPAILDSIRVALQDQTIIYSSSVMAYLSGLLGIPISQLIPDANRISVAINGRMRRVFYGHLPQFTIIKNGFTPVGIIGLKGSGKSYLIQELLRRGEHVHEVYTCLDEMRSTNSPLLSALPHPSKWETEPLRLGFQFRGWDVNIPQRFFVGNLLRLSEIAELYRIGNPLLVYISVPNRLRHERARWRGRLIEAQASENRLIELDAHRGGEWTGYEANNIGSLVLLAHVIVINDGTSSVESMVDFILDEVSKHEA